MRNTTLTAFVLGTMLTSTPLVMASPTTIMDNYIGANPTHSYAHVDSIGGIDFNLTKMEVNFTGNKMTVDIYADRYFNKTLPFESTRLGDLFISTNGLNTPYPNGGTTNDTRSTGEQWEWVAALDDHAGTSGSIRLYAVNTDRILNSNLDGLDLNRYIYREDQEWAYDTTGLDDAGSLGSGSWSRNETILSLSIDMPEAWLGSSEFGLHWGMSCGNDVIEGAAPAPVPEPATMLLFGTGLFGLAGLAGAGKRKKLSSGSARSASSANGEGTAKSNFHHQQRRTAQVFSVLTL